MITMYENSRNFGAIRARRRCAKQQQQQQQQQLIRTQQHYTHQCVKYLNNLRSSDRDSWFWCLDTWAERSRRAAGRPALQTHTHSDSYKQTYTAKSSWNYQVRIRKFCLWLILPYFKARNVLKVCPYSCLSKVTISFLSDYCSLKLFSSLCLDIANMSH